VLATSAEVPKDLLTWRNNVRQLKQRHLRGESVVGYYPELEAVASEHGLQGVFDVKAEDDRRRETLCRVEALCQRISQRGQWPSKNSSFEQERTDATLVSAIRMAKQGCGKHLYLPEMDEVAVRHGLSGLFDDQKTRMLDQTREFCRKYRDGRLPTAMPNDTNRKDGQWLAAKRRVKAGEASGTWYPEMDDIAREEGFNGLFDTEVITWERALDWLSRHYRRHAEYPKVAQERVQEAVEDGYGYRDITWSTVNHRHRLRGLVDAIRQEFSPALVVKWNHEELKAGRPALTKTGTAIVESARADGYPVSGSEINSRLLRDHRRSLADLLRPSSRTDFSVAMAERWLKEEHKATGYWPTVTSACIRSAEADGYAGLSGNALNKLLRKAGTSLREVKLRLVEDAAEEKRNGQNTV
jgi:hypothetical protein